MNYIEASSSEHHGSLGSLGVRIMVAADRELTENDKNEIRRSSDRIVEAIFAENIKIDPRTLKASEKERAEIVGLFSGPIFVEEIPNGYCNRYCCEHLPWFVITTTKGRIQIGWRKRVLSIDWSETTISSTADELFPDEDTTKGEQSIHAWSIEKAHYYINTILSSPKGTPS